MISTITGHASTATDRDALVAEDALLAASADQGDSGSSSLSDLDVDGASDDDDQPSPSVALRTELDEPEVDSEAETERLERTPRKLDDPAGSVKQATEKSPSKLSQVISKADASDAESDHPKASTPSVVVGLDQASSRLDVNNTLRKRKRSDYEDKSLGENTFDEPSPKRSHSSKDDLAEGELTTVDAEIANDDLLSDLGEAKSNSPKDELNEPQAGGDADETPLPTEEVDEVEHRAPARGRPGRRGRRKGRRGAPPPPLPQPAPTIEEPENIAEASDAPVQEPDADAEEQPELEQEEEDEVSHDEERRFTHSSYPGTC
jgi:hypothetical protein